MLLFVFVCWVFFIFVFVWSLYWGIDLVLFGNVCFIEWFFIENCLIVLIFFFVNDLGCYIYRFILFLVVRFRLGYLVFIKKVIVIVIEF